MAFFGNKRKDFSIQPPKQQVDGTPFYVTDSANIDFTLANLNLTANLTQLLPTSGTYGDATNIPVLQIDQWGRITGVTTIAIGGGGGTYTVNNGLTESPANNFQLGGTLIQNTDLTNSSFYLRFTQSAGKALELYSNDAEALLAQRANTSRNTVDTVARLVRRSTTNPLGIWTQSGFGAGLDFDLMMSNGVVTTAGRISANWDSPISPSERSYLKFATRKSGVLSDKMVIDDFGIIGFNSYGSGTITDTLAYALGVNSSGQVIEYTPGTGTVTNVTATSPITSSGGATPDISTSMATNKLIGRGTAGTGVMEEITLGTGLSLSGTTLNVTTTSGGILHGTTSGTDTYTTTIVGATAYADGDAYLIRFAIGNTTSATLNINSQGAIPLYRNNDGPLLGGDVLAGGEMICVYNSTLNIFQCIGVSPNSLIAYVTNDDSVTITKGQPVYAFSGTGDRMTVKLAYNTGDSTSAQTVGLVLSTSIAANQKGLIMMQGLLDGLSNVKPVNGWADGSPVYLGTTAGSITPTKQYAPNHLVYLGFVTTASPGSAGRVYVRVQNGFEMAELHDVQAQTPANNDTLYYDNVTTPLKPQWKTTSVNTLLNPSIKTGSFGVTVDGVSSTIQVGQTGFVTMPYAGTITGWSITTNASGSIQFGVWKASGAIPTVSNSIVASAPPTLTSAQFITSTTLTGWTTTFASGDVFGFYVNSVSSTVKNATLTIRTTKT